MLCLISIEKFLGFRIRGHILGLGYSKVHYPGLVLLFKGPTKGNVQPTQTANPQTLNPKPQT